MGTQRDLDVRGAIEGLATAHPLGCLLPSVYLEDGFAQQLTGALDVSLAPVLSTLDNLDAYLDPELTPRDFLGWLAGWVALEVDDTSPEEQRRARVARAARLHRRRGTLAGLVDLVALQTGTEAEVTDSGGVAWSTVAGSPLPGHAAPTVSIRIRVPDPATVDLPALEAAVAAGTAAHVQRRIEVVRA